MAWLFGEIRFALRSIRKERAFFFACVAALALGIGGSTVIFSVIDNVPLNPFPYRASSRIDCVFVEDKAHHGAAARNYFPIGVYSVTAYMVSRQRKEIGIRMALGAAPGEIMAWVLRRATRFVAAGVGIGVVGALVGAKLLASQFWGIAWYDPPTLAGWRFC